MKSERPTTRAGFTLIEILMVIALIAALSSILVGLVRGVIGTSRQAATKSTIIKISRMLEDRVEAFHRYMDKLDKRAGNDRSPRYVKLRHRVQAGGKRNLALILARKDEFRKQFPQMFSEDNESIFNPNSNSFQLVLNWPHADPEVERSEDQNSNGVLDPGEDINGNGILDLDLLNLHDPITESSECLYYFLTQGETFGSEAVAPDAFTSTEIKDTDGDGLMEFVDSWGNPLRFYRWPTRLIRPNPSNNLADPQWVENTGNNRLGRNFRFKIDETAAAVVFGPLSSAPLGVFRLPKSSGATFRHELEDPLSRDGDDPLGETHRWLNTGPGFDFRMRPAEFEKRYHTPDTYHAPLILSVGSDGELGLYEPYEGALIQNPNDFKELFYKDTNFGRLAQPIITSANPRIVVDESFSDNIYNLYLRSGVTR